MVTQMHPNLRLVSADITPENFLDDLEEMVGALGVHDSIRQLAMFRNYKVLRQNGVKVALTGEGADEFNWGYWHKFPGLKLDQEACKDGGSFRKLIAGRGDFVRALIAKGKRKEIDFDGDTNGLLEIYNGFKTNDSRKKMMGVYATDFLAFLNKANDRCGMANSIESRCPFQDVNVIETCLNIPREYQIRGESEKEVLRESFKEILPAQVYRRAKAPLPAASHLDYHRQIAREFDKRIESTDSSFWKYFDRDAFSQMAKSYNGKINYLGRTYRSPDEAGAELVKWRPIGERARIIDGTGLRTNDVFKLLTAMVWYNQNMKGGARR